MGLNDLIDSKKSKEKEKKGGANPASQKEYKSYYLEKGTIDLINKLYLTERIENSNYSLADAFNDAFSLLAEQRGIKK